MSEGDWQRRYIRKQDRPTSFPWHDLPAILLTIAIVIGGVLVIGRML